MRSVTVESLVEPEDDDKNDTVDDGDNIELDINKDGVDTIKLENDGVDITKSEICDDDKDRSKLEMDNGFDIVTDGAAKVKDGTGTPELDKDDEIEPLDNDRDRK